jgi:hypothetical protein
MKDAENDPQYHGIAKFIFAWSFSIATDSWGPVPFADAFDPQIREPAYDEQKVVYEGVQKLIDEAVAEMAKTEGKNPGIVDLLYRGDMAKWGKLAHTVQAQLHMRLTTAPGENKTDRAQKALTELAKGFASNADDADFAYPGGNNRRPPWYAIGRGNESNNNASFVADAFLLGMMQQRSDPRIRVFFQPAPLDTPNIVYRGHVSGSGSGGSRDFSRIGNYFAGDSASLNWVSYAHAKFLEAEARLYVSGAAAADPAYRAAIRANMEKLRVASADIDAYLAARPPLASSTNALAEIMRGSSSQFPQARGLERLAAHRLPGRYSRDVGVPDRHSTTAAYARFRDHKQRCEARRHRHPDQPGRHACEVWWASAPR